MTPLFKFLGLCFLFLLGVIAFLLVDNPIRNIGGPSTAAIEQLVAEQKHDVIMYSLTTCGYCTAKRKEFERYGVKFTEHFLDQDRAVMHQLSRKLALQGNTSGNVGTPLFEINGQLIHGNPPIQTLAQYW